VGAAWILDEQETLEGVASFANASRISGDGLLLGSGFTMTQELSP